MSKSKKKICKVPNCKKEVPGEKGIFCSHHSKVMKEGGKAAGGSMLAASLAIFAVAKKKG